jgi:predicted acyltransferase
MTETLDRAANDGQAAELGNGRPGSAASASSPSERLVALDALRGADMFCILGGTTLAAQLIDYFHLHSLAWIKPHLNHVDWHGFSAHDLIFPLFIFIAGCAMPLSLGKRAARGDSRSRLVLHVARRSALLILCGLIYNGLLRLEWGTLRYPSVLGMIGLAYFWGAMVFLFFKPRGRLIAAGMILAAYCLAMFLYVRAVPLYTTEASGAGGRAKAAQPLSFREELTPGHNLVGAIDQRVLPGRLHEGNFDPEGLLAMFPASVLAILGSLAGGVLTCPSKPASKKLLLLAASGVVLLGIGWVWGLWFPINKKLWTSSFILFSAGWSLLLLAGFYSLADVCRLRKLFFPFVLIGMNSITIYMIAYKKLIDFNFLSGFFFGGAIRWAPEELRPLLGTVGSLVFLFLFLWFLHRKKIYLKL